MAEQDIVACSGCGKKFRIPDGSPPSGKFACTACGADVAWGGASGGGSGRKPGKGGRSRARRAAMEKKDGGGASRGARRARGRRARDEGADDEGGGGGSRRGHLPKEKENKTVPLIAALMGVVLLVAVAIIIFTGDPPDYDAQAAASGSITDTTDSGDTGVSDGTSGTTSGTEDTGTEGASTGTETPAAPLVPLAPDMGDEDDESGIGGAEAVAEQAKDYRYWFLREKDELFADIPPIEGTTDEEAAEYRELAAKATDFDAGAQGMKAEGQLAKIGRKAMPFLMQQFEKAWKGSKWTEPGEQFACSKIQQLAREITKADGPPSDLFVRFPPGPGVEASHYQRAARMWAAWWRGEGQHIEKFKSYEDEE
jgi:hypothetical protein